MKWGNRVVVICWFACVSTYSFYNCTYIEQVLWKNKIIVYWWRFVMDQIGAESKRGFWESIALCEHLFNQLFPPSSYSNLRRGINDYFSFCFISMLPPACSCCQLIKHYKATLINYCWKHRIYLHRIYLSWETLNIKKKRIFQKWNNKIIQK